MNRDVQATITINSYQKIWGYERMVYQITNSLSLPTPIEQSDLLYFVCSLMVVTAFCVIFKPPVSSLAAVILVYVGIPCGATAMLRHRTFDGKNPFVFMLDVLQFYIERRQEREFFTITPKEPAHRAAWQLGYRHRLRLPTGKGARINA